MTTHERKRRQRKRRQHKHSAQSDRLYLPPDEFARRAGVGRATIWRMMADGRLRYARFGRVRRIPVTEYERLTTGAIAAKHPGRPPKATTTETTANV